MIRNHGYWILHDRIEKDGKVTPLHDRKLSHVGSRKIHGRKNVVVLIDCEEVAVLDLQTSEILGLEQIGPGRSYWLDKQKSLGRWSGDSDQIL